MKKGFTLVELLAVIVILAIILAIAIPSISNMIKNSTKQAFESDAKMILKAINYKILENSNFDPTIVNETNINLQLNIGDTNYKSIDVIKNNAEISIIVVGKNKWNNFVAVGTSNNMQIHEGLQLWLDASIATSYPGTGTTWYDLSGNNRNGTMSSVDITAGYSSFNSSADNITFSSFIIPGEKTLSFWIKTDRPLSDTDSWKIGFYGGGTSVSGSLFGMVFGVNITQDLGFWGYNSPYDFSVTSPTTKWIDLNTWVNVTCTMDSNRNVRIYKNGVIQTLNRSSDGAVAQTYPMASDTLTSFIINSGTWVAGHTYINLANIQVYDRALSIEEIQKNFDYYKQRFGL